MNIEKKKNKYCQDIKKQIKLLSTEKSMDVKGKGSSDKRNAVQLKRSAKSSEKSKKLENNFNKFSSIFIIY